ncbi:MAG: hypothetical protein ACUVRD_01885 [Bacteroidia bacterium]
MKKWRLRALLLFFLPACEPHPPKEALRLFLPYLSPLPTPLRPKEKKAYLAQQEKQYIWLLYHTEGDTQYFGLMRPVKKSLTDKYQAVVGRWVGTDSLVYYEELFWMWPMKKSLLQKRTREVFDYYLRTRSLTPYLPQNAQDEYIMFPDENTFFSPACRCWALIWLGDTLWWEPKFN